MFNRRVKEVIPTVAVNSIASLMGQSANAIDVFNKTREKLLSINAKIDKEVSDRQDEMAKLQGEIESLGGRKATNNRIATNIEKILND